MRSWTSIWSACGYTGFIGADPAMAVGGEYEPSLESVPVYTLLTFPFAHGLHLHRTGALGDPSLGAQCVDLTPDNSALPGGSTDQPRVAWLPPVPGLLPPSLAMVWNGGGIWPNSNHELATIALGQAGEVLPSTLNVTTLPQPFEASANTDYSRCSIPTTTRSDRGRGTLIATPGGALFHAYTNYLDDTQPHAVPPVPHRVYVEKIGAQGWSVCLDESVPEGVVTSENYFDLGDPALRFDARSGRLVVAYPLRNADGFRDIVLATAVAAEAQDSSAWSFIRVNDRDARGDRGQPALAVNTLDALERAASGAVYVSWYEPTLDAISHEYPINAVVERYARGFRFVSGELQPRSASFSVSEPFFANVTSQIVDDTGDPRGTHEYQTMAHIPGTADWIGVWGQPKDPESPLDPDVGEFRLRWSTWD